MIKNKAIIIVIVCVCLVASLIGFGYAYYGDNERVVNDFSVGENTIEIVEDFDSTFDDYGDIKKVIQVKNVGTMPCYVRTLAVVDDAYNPSTYSIDWNSSGDWLYNEMDGYYYYKYTLDVGEQTSPLCTKVSIFGDADLTDFSVIAYAESIQVGEYVDDIKSAWASFGVDLPA